MEAVKILTGWKSDPLNAGAHEIGLQEEGVAQAATGSTGRSNAAARFKAPRAVIPAGDAASSAIAGLAHTHPVDVAPVHTLNLARAPVHTHTDVAPRHTPHAPVLTDRNHSHSASSPTHAPSLLTRDDQALGRVPAFAASRRTSGRRAAPNIAPRMLSDRGPVRDSLSDELHAVAAQHRQLYAPGHVPEWLERHFERAGMLNTDRATTDTLELDTRLTRGSVMTYAISNSADSTVARKDKGNDGMRMLLGVISPICMVVLIFIALRWLGPRRKPQKHRTSELRSDPFHRR